MVPKTPPIQPLSIIRVPIGYYKRSIKVIAQECFNKEWKKQEIEHTKTILHLENVENINRSRSQYDILPLHYKVRFALS